jgi:hypothetical protein
MPAFAGMTGRPCEDKDSSATPFDKQDSLYGLSWAASIPRWSYIIHNRNRKIIFADPFARFVAALALHYAEHGVTIA